MDYNQARKAKIAELATNLLSFGWPEWLVDGFARALAGANLLGSTIEPDVNVVAGLRVSHRVVKERGISTGFDRRDRSGFEFTPHIPPGEGLMEVILSDHSRHDPLAVHYQMIGAPVPVSTGGRNFDANLVRALANNGRHHNDGELVTVGADIFVFAILAHEMLEEGLEVRVAIDDSEDEGSAGMYICGNGYEVYVMLDLVKVADHIQTGGRRDAQLH